MEHPCDKCGAAVEDGVAFCPQCAAPQIRVLAEAATPPLPPGTPEQLQPPAQPVPLTPAGEPPEADRLDWRHGFPVALTSGAVLAICFALPWAGFLLWGIVGGALAVALYQRRKQVTVTAGLGARLGAVTGLLGFVAFAVIISLELLLTRGAGIRELWRQMLEHAAARNPQPAVQEMMQRLSTPQGMAWLFTLTMIVVLGVFLVFSSLGGLIGASLFGKHRRKS